MTLPRLLRTTAVRLAVRYVVLYMLVLGLALAAFGWTTSRYVDAGVRSALREEFNALQASFHLGSAAVARSMEGRLRSGAHDRFYLLVSADGRHLAGNLATWPEDAGVALDGAIHSVWLPDDMVPVETDDDEVYWPVIAGALPDGGRLLVAHSVAQVEALQELAEYLLEVLGAATVLSLIMGITIGMAILRRMETVGRTAEKIMAGDLSQRVPVGTRGDEFDALAQRLNAMLERVQQLISGIREVTDNVAHDLRSPLTRLRNQLEVALLEPRSAAEYRQVIGGGIEETEHLIRTFNALLKIARAEAGNHREQWDDLDLSALVSDMMELYRPLADQKSQNITFGDNHDTRIRGNRELLAQAIGNVIDNAVKYTPAGGAIGIAVTGNDDGVEVTISDTGPGIPVAEREHVFERFVRLDGSRNAPGNGLGLSLVRAACTLHGAQLRLEAAEPGLRVVMRFRR